MGRTMKFFGLFGFAAAEEIVRYDGDKVYGFENLTNGAIQHIKTYDAAFGGFDFWSPESAEEMMIGQNAHFRVSAENTAEFESLMAQFDIPYAVRSENVQDDIDAEYVSTLMRDGKAHSLTNFNEFDEIKQYLIDVAANTANAEYKTFGKSFEGRDMIAIEIGTGSKVIAIDCGIHAREWISPAYCQWFINEATSGKFAQYTNEVKFVVQPVINPDGYSYCWTNQRLWRKNRSQQGNCKGVDLNRNYEANWGGPGASGNSCSDTFRGPSVFSESESKAQRDYLAPMFADQSMKAFLTFHSYGQYILYPYSYDYTSKSPNKQEMDDVGAAMAAEIRKIHQKKYTMGQGTQVLYPAAGGSDDWAHDEMLKNGNNKPLSYTFELRDEGRYGFVLPANQIEPNCEEVDGALDYIINYVINNK